MATILYVDGKLGSDGHAGTKSAPFKTIAAAIAALPQGTAGQAAGCVVSVTSYLDYVYRERAIPAGVVCSGTADAPLIIQSTGSVGNLAQGAPLVPATVDGSVPVTAASSSGLAWTTVSGTVWKTPWTNALSLQAAWLDYTDTQRKERAWLNTRTRARTSTPLRRPVPAAGAGQPLTIADLQAQGYSYFLDRWSAQGAGICSTAPGSGALPTLGTLYVNLAPPVGITNPAYVAPASTDPRRNRLEMPYQPTFSLDDGWAFMELRGLRAWHGDLGFHVGEGSHDITFTRCDGSFNFCMGFATFGTDDEPVRNITLRGCSGTGNSIQAVKLEGTTTGVVIDQCMFNENALQDGVDIVGSGVHDVAVMATTIRDGNLMPGYARYYDGGKIVSITLEDACYDITVSGCTLANAANGIATYISGAPALSHGNGPADPLYGGDFGLVATGNTVRDMVHTGSDSGFGISCGYPDVADEAGCDIAWSGNTVTNCDGGGSGTHDGAWFAPTLTGKTFA